MEYSKLKKQQTKHLLNIKEDNRYLPLPMDAELECQERATQNLFRKTAKGVLDILWKKYNRKVSRTIWLVSFDNIDNKIKSGKVEFRFYDVVVNDEFKSEEELKQFLNLQLLKHIGITVEMYYLFYHVYTRKIFIQRGEEKIDHFCWYGTGKKN